MKRFTFLAIIMALVVGFNSISFADSKSEFIEQIKPTIVKKIKRSSAVDAKNIIIDIKSSAVNEKGQTIACVTATFFSEEFKGECIIVAFIRVYERRGVKKVGYGAETFKLHEQITGYSNLDRRKMGDHEIEIQKTMKRVQEKSVKMITMI